MTVQKTRWLLEPVVLGIVAFMTLPLTWGGGTFLAEGLSAANAAQELKGSGVTATVTNVRIHVGVSISQTSSSQASGSSKYSGTSPHTTNYAIDHVQVDFLDTQGNKRSDDLSTWEGESSIPHGAGWTSEFKGHDRYVGKQVVYLPNRPAQAMMSDKMTDTLAHGFDPGKTYLGIGLLIPALVGWGLVVRGVISRRRGRQRSGIA